MDKDSIDGGPAFPKTGNFGEKQSGEYDSVDQDGMSLRDYFAAKAPAEIPHWFQTAYQDPTPEPVAPTLKADDADVQQLCDDWRQDPYFDLYDRRRVFHPHQVEFLRRYEGAWKAYWQERIAWQNQREIDMYFAWRWYYADCMLAEGKEGEV